MMSTRGSLLKLFVTVCTVLVLMLSMVSPDACLVRSVRFVIDEVLIRRAVFVLVSVWIKS